jgi:hypothetical protein
VQIIDEKDLPLNGAGKIDRTSPRRASTRPIFHKRKTPGSDPALIGLMRQTA